MSLYFLMAQRTQCLILIEHCCSWGGKRPSIYKLLLVYLFCTISERLDLYSQSINQDRQWKNNNNPEPLCVVLSRRLPYMIFSKCVQNTYLHTVLIEETQTYRWFPGTCPIKQTKKMIILDDKATPTLRRAPKF